MLLVLANAITAAGQHFNHDRGREEETIDGKLHMNGFYFAEVICGVYCTAKSLFIPCLTKLYCAYPKDQSDTCIRMRHLQTLSVLMAARVYLIDWIPSRSKSNDPVPVPQSVNT